MDNLIGQSLGRYHILEPLGEGGMAMVYKAFDTRLERNVAVKIILPSRQQNEKFLKRFEREARALAQLTHPNIVGVIDYGEHDGLPYLVMEYISGGTLKQKLTGKPVPWQEAARVLAPVARALEYAHLHHVIHRDVKPSNILITDSGQPMLTDFGIAKILESEETTDLTGSSTGVGTPEYMAPEQGLGHAVDQRADIYALGIVLYELIAGRKPYRADTPMAVVLKHVTEPLPRPRQFVPDLPERVEQILIKALAKKPEERYQTMREFAGVLESLASGVLPRAMPGMDAAESSRPPKLDNRRKIGIILGIGILLVAGVCILLGFVGFPILADYLKGAAAQAPTAIPGKTMVSPPTETVAPVASPSAPTSVNSIPPCPGPLPSRLQVGMNAKVTETGVAWQLRLRSEPGFNAPTNHIIAAGRTMVILDGPTCAEGSYWWYVRSEQGYEGWAPEGDYEDYWIDPLP